MSFLPLDWKKYIRFKENGEIVEMFSEEFEPSLSASFFGKDYLPVYGVQPDTFKCSFKYTPGFWDVLPKLCDNADRTDFGQGFSMQFREFDLDDEGNARHVSYALQYRFAEKDLSLMFIILSRRRKVGFLEMNDYIEITGTGFRLFKPQFFFECLQNLFVTLHRVKRCDICVDYEIESDPLLKAVHRTAVSQKRTTNIICHHGLAETVNLAADNNTNTYRFPRVYDKVAETRVRSKFHLYPVQKPRTRFEIELRKDKCKNFVPTWLMDRDKLRTIFLFEFREVIKFSGGEAKLNLLPVERGLVSCCERPTWEKSHYDKSISREKGMLQTFLVRAFERKTPFYKVLAFVFHTYRLWEQNPDFRKRAEILRSRRSSAPS